MSNHRNSIPQVMKALLYLRVSTVHQKESREGIRAQLKACKEEAARLNIKRVYVFKDVGISGYTEIEERTGLSNALIILQPRDVLIVASRDRIARDTAIAGRVEEIVEQKEAMLISVAGEGTAVPGAQGLKERRMADVHSEVLRELIIENTIESLQSKKRKGERAGTVPYGLQLADDRIGLRPCKKELIVINLAKHLRLQGLSLRDIVQEINGQGYRGRTGHLFQLNQIVNMLEDNNQFIDIDAPVYSKVLFLPYGYTLKEDGKCTEECAKEQKVIALVKKLRLEGYSLRAIAKELNQRGYRGRTGNLFQHRQISRILIRAVNKNDGDPPTKKNVRYGLKLAQDGITIEPCLQEQAVIQQAQLLKTQGHTLRNITKELNVKGFLGRTGKPFQLTQVARIIKRTVETSF